VDELEKRVKEFLQKFMSSRRQNFGIHGWITLDTVKRVGAEFIINKAVPALSNKQEILDKLNSTIRSLIKSGKLSYREEVLFTGGELFEEEENG